MVYGHLFHIGDPYDGLLIHIHGTMTIPLYGYTIQVLTMAHMSKAKKPLSFHYTVWLMGIPWTVIIPNMLDSIIT